MATTGTHLADLQARRPGGPGIVSPAHFLMAMRDTGYRTTSLAVAEFIDNSVQASARRVSVDICPGADSRYPIEISVSDDGTGMDAATLADALALTGNRAFAAARQHLQEVADTDISRVAHTARHLQRIPAVPHTTGPAPRPPVIHTASSTPLKVREDTESKVEERADLEAQEQAKRRAARASQRVRKASGWPIEPQAGEQLESQAEERADLDAQEQVKWRAARASQRVRKASGWPVEPQAGEQLESQAEERADLEVQEQVKWRAARASQRVRKASGW